MTVRSPGKVATDMIRAPQSAGEPARSFQPIEPKSLEQTGLSEGLLDSLILKYLLGMQSSGVRKIAAAVCIPYSILDKRVGALKGRRLLTSTDVNSFGDFTVQLTEEGHQQARLFADACAYVGPAPVPLADYIEAVKQQSVASQPTNRESIEQSFNSISMSASLLGRVGQAVRSGSGLFLYGAAGNGKTTIAQRVGNCFGSAVWMPHALEVGGTIVQLYDPAYHVEQPATQSSSLLRDQAHDTRWIRMQRPTVVAGGELTLDSLEIRHDPMTRISEAPLQLKANNGVLVIDDFGRQRVSPTDLLNRWIVPLDRKIDLLTMNTGKRIEVPFELVVVFSTNLEPSDLVDEAFLRRIPYKIHVPDPSEEEFLNIFRGVTEKEGISFEPEAIERLLERHYRATNRPLRRCHPRDLLNHLLHFCDFQGLPREMSAETLDRIAGDYFLHGPTLRLNAS